jgi:hypothetical protein
MPITPQIDEKLDDFEAFQHHNKARNRPKIMDTNTIYRQETTVRISKQNLYVSFLKSSRGLLGCQSVDARLPCWLVWKVCGIRSLSSLLCDAPLIPR